MGDTKAVQRLGSVIGDIDIVVVSPINTNINLLHRNVPPLLLKLERATGKVPL